MNDERVDVRTGVCKRTKTTSSTFSLKLPLGTNVHHSHYFSCVVLISQNQQAEKDSFITIKMKCIQQTLALCLLLASSAHAFTRSAPTSAFGLKANVCPLSMSAVAEAPAETAGTVASVDKIRNIAGKSIMFIPMEVVVATDFCDCWNSHMIVFALF